MSLCKLEINDTDIVWISKIYATTQNYQLPGQFSGLMMRKKYDTQVLGTEMVWKYYVYFDDAH